MNDAEQKQKNVLASFLVLDSLDKDNIQVVSMGMGTKSIYHSLMKEDKQGMVLHDSHAEVLARRGLVQYLLRFLMESHKNVEQQKEQIEDAEYLKKTYFQRNEKWRLKSNQKLMLYISQSPCGQCSMNTFKGDNQQFDAFNLGGAKPLNEFFNQQYGELKNDQSLIRTQPARTDMAVHMRSYSISCTDKILKWSVMGVQGTALSYFFDPLYIDYIMVQSKTTTNEKLYESINIKQRFNISLSELRHQLLEKFQNHNQIKNYQIKVPNFITTNQIKFIFSREQDNDEQPLYQKISWIYSNQVIGKQDLINEIIVNGQKQGANSKNFDNPKVALQISKYWIAFDLLQVVSKQIGSGHLLKEETYLDFKQKDCEMHDKLKSNFKRMIGSWTENKFECNNFNPILIQK